MDTTRDSHGCATPQSCGVSTACVPAGRRPCIELTQAHRDELGLADAVEGIAVSLAGEVDRFACLLVASSLLPKLRNSSTYEESTVFPALLPKDPKFEVSVLEADHMERDWLAQEVTDLLLVIGRAEKLDDPVAAQATLRAFATALRRHVTRESERLLPVMPEA
ncbi:MAG: hemerythrin domain-containing protein [Rhizobiaceae bacterium]|nr:hemerythrin domain-containing protein [Rhizobiaceae bacterium]